MASAQTQASEGQHETGGNVIDMSSPISSGDNNPTDAEVEDLPIGKDDNSAVMQEAVTITHPAEVPNNELVDSEPSEKMLPPTIQSDKPQPAVESIAIPTDGNHDVNFPITLPSQEVLGIRHPVESVSNAGEVSKSESPEGIALLGNQSDKVQPPAELLVLSTSLLPADLEVPAEVTNKNGITGKTNPQNESPEMSDTSENDDAETTALQSSDPVVTKPPGFLESLTAEFAPETKAMWARIFGPRYEDDNEGVNGAEEDPPSVDTNRSYAVSKSSLLAKLERGRRLDEQIQASQRRYQERIMRNTAANNTARDRTTSGHRRVSKAQNPSVSPFEQAGLSLTQIRFCTEKALDETCKCFRNLHAVALEEAEDPANSNTQGIFITQGELELLLRELFDPQEVAPSVAMSRKGSLIAPLDFTISDDVAPVDGISMNTLLQASWFLPFGQLPQLRTLVMKITRRHLNEEKLATVNCHLQKQLTLLPLSSKLQKLVLQFSEGLMGKPMDIPAAKLQLQSSVSLAHGMLESIAVTKGVALADATEDNGNFLLLSPGKLMAEAQLSSVVCAQRLVFFHFLIEVIAAERMRTRPKRTGLLAATLPDRASNVVGTPTPSKEKPIARKRSRNASKCVPVDSEPDINTADVTDQSCTDHTGIENPPDQMATLAAHESLSSISQVSDDEPPFYGTAPFPTETEQNGDECEKPANLLQQQLESAIAHLREVMPNIDSVQDHDRQSHSVKPAFRATYLAAVACQQSVQLMVEHNIEVDGSMSEKLQHFIQALATIQTDCEPLIIPPVQYSEDIPEIPDPPYPESTPTEESEENNENITAQAHFPPPYEITSPSYWTFEPSIPEPKTSISKLENKYPSNRPANPRFHFLPQSSPGIGIQEGDKHTFQSRLSYSCGPTGGHRSVRQSTAISSFHVSPPRRSLRKQSPGVKLHQRTKKTPVVYMPPPPDDKPQSTGNRVYASSQYDSSHLVRSYSDDILHSPALEYAEGDASGAPNFDADGDKDNEDHAGTNMTHALRLQQRMFMDEFVHQVVSKQEAPSRFTNTTRSTSDNKRGATTSNSKPYWATCQVSPGIERLLYRQRRAPSSSKPRPASARSRPAPSPPQSRVRATSKRVTINAPPDSPPPRRQLDNDQHLAWAARISELYQAESTV